MALHHFCKELMHLVFLFVLLLGGGKPDGEGGAVSLAASTSLTGSWWGFLSTPPTSPLSTRAAARPEFYSAQQPSSAVHSGRFITIPRTATRGTPTREGVSLTDTASEARESSGSGGVVSLIGSWAAGLVLLTQSPTRDPTEVEGTHY